MEAGSNIMNKIRIALNGVPMRFDNGFAKNGQIDLRHFPANKIPFI
jgi:hypothetical protein